MQVAGLVPRWLVSGVVLIVVATRRRELIAGVALVASVVLGANAWHAAPPAEVGQCDGVIRVIDDPVASAHVALSLIHISEPTRPY